MISKIWAPIVVMLFLFSSCSGQATNESQISNINSIAVGKLVLALDAKTWYVYQDQKDNYWFGSNGNGLIHFDGKRLLNYTMEDGLVDNTIRRIQEDHLGNVFVDTPNGVSKFDGVRFETLQKSESENNEWRLDPNDLWFTCNGKVEDVYRYDGEYLYEMKLPRKDLDKAFGREVRGLSFKDMSHSPYSVYGIDKDKAGNIWFGTITAGAFRYDGESFLWVAENELSELPDGRVPGVRSMLEDKEGYMWLSNFVSKYQIVNLDALQEYQKLVGVDMSKGQFDDRLPYFNAGLSDKNGDLWMTTYTGGVWKYVNGELKNFPVGEGITEALIISIYEDNHGVLWLGTDNIGVFRFNGEAFEKFAPLKK